MVDCTANQSLVLDADWTILEIVGETEMDQMNEKLNDLDAIARHVGRGDDRCYGGLSSGERMYVAVAANRHDLLDAEHYTMLQAIVRVDSEWRGELFKRWRSIDPSDLRSED